MRTGASMVISTEGVCPGGVHPVDPEADIPPDPEADTPREQNDRQV